MARYMYVCTLVKGSFLFFSSPPPSSSFQCKAGPFALGNGGGRRGLLNVGAHQCLFEKEGEEEGTEHACAYVEGGKEVCAEYFGALKRCEN